eukprot:470113-Hanusia_phi.AAC.2
MSQGEDERTFAVMLLASRSACPSAGLSPQTFFVLLLAASFVALTCQVSPASWAGIESASSEMSGEPASGGSRRKERSARKFDFSKHASRHIALEISYLGWDFKGFASQEDTNETIEGQLFAALTKACLIPSRAASSYSRCARTDKGVSAVGQVVALRVRSKLGGPGIIAPSPWGEGEENGTGTKSIGEEEAASLSKEEWMARTEGAPHQGELLLGFC